MKKCALSAICHVLLILMQNADATDASKKKPVLVDDVEPEEEENKSPGLVDLMDKALDSKEDLSVSLMKKPSLSKKKAASLKEKKKPDALKLVKERKSAKNRKQSKKFRKTYATPLEKDIQSRLLQNGEQANAPNENIKDQDEAVKENSLESAEENEDVENRAEHDGSSSSLDQADSRMENSEKQENKTGSLEDEAEEEENRRKTNLVNTTLGGSVEDETVEEDTGGRKAAIDRKFEDVYRYENEPLKNMLLWLVLNSVNPVVKNPIKASKAAIDKYVKHTVDKAATQAALRYTDYSSIRFDKDKIIMYCGGQVVIYNTLKDSKICFNGQIYEVRLI